MTRITQLCAGVVLIAGGISLGWFAHFPHPLKATATTNVNANQIPKEVALIGKLQVPLMTPVKITGRWMYQRDDVNKGSKELAFVVDRVLDRNLDESAVYFQRNIQAADEWMYASDHEKLTSPTDGEIWTGMAYETAYLHGQPMEIYDHIGCTYRYVPENGHFVCELNLYDMTSSAEQ